MFCNKCGNELKKDEIFCSNCGQKKEVDKKPDNVNVSSEDNTLKETNNNVNDKLDPENINNKDVSTSNSAVISNDVNRPKEGSQAPLILGICSILTSSLLLVSLPLSIIGLVQHKKNKKINPNFSSVGKILSIIGIVLSTLFTLLTVLFLSFFIKYNIFNAIEELVTQDYYSEKIDDTKRVGSFEYGYIQVPDDWTKVSSSNQFGYSDEYNDEILTMFEYSESDLELEQVITNIMNLINTNSYELVAQGSEYISGLETTTLSLYNEEYDKYVKVWLFLNPDSDAVHFISFESSDEDSDVFELIDTFDLYK